MSRTGSRAPISVAKRRAPGPKRGRDGVAMASGWLELGRVLCAVVVGLLVACRMARSDLEPDAPPHAASVAEAPSTEVNQDGSPRWLPPSAPDVPGRAMVFPYADFGPPSMAHALLGLDVYAWGSGACCGAVDDSHDVRVVVYTGVSEGEVRGRYPTVEGQADHRLVAAEHARAFLVTEIEGLTDDPLPALDELRRSLQTTLESVSALIVASAPCTCGDGAYVEASCDPGVLVESSSSCEGARIRFLASSPFVRAMPGQDREFIDVFLPAGGGGRGDRALVDWVIGIGATPGEPVASDVPWARRAVPFTTSTGRGTAYSGELRGRAFFVRVHQEEGDPPNRTAAARRILGSLRLTKGAWEMLGSDG